MKERANPDRTKKKELITLKLIPVVVAASEVRIFALMKVKAIIPVAPHPNARSANAINAEDVYKTKMN